MDVTALLLGLVLGLVAGLLGGWLLLERSIVGPARKRGERLEATLDAEVGRSRELERELEGLRVQLKQQERAVTEKLELLDDAEQRLSNTFKALAADTLKGSGESFLKLAQLQLEKYQDQARSDLDQRKRSIDELVKPIADGLTKVDRKIEEVEKVRLEAYGALVAQIRGLGETQQRLHGETEKLVRALRTPSVRGRWGEIQLRRVVEIAGMIQHCDFVVQESVKTERGVRRPDMTIRLPNNRCVVVDSKVPLDQYLNSLETEDGDVQRQHLKEHAKQLRRHIQELAGKSYWDRLEDTPEFVVLFLPGEAFFGAALEQDPTLIEYGVDQRVILSTPTTLIALLKAVAYGWKQEQISQSAAEIAGLGRQLYDRVRSFTTHLQSTGDALSSAVRAYNQAVGSFETRLLVSARRLRELGVASGDEVTGVTGIEQATRAISSPDALTPPEQGNVFGDADDSGA